MNNLYDMFIVERNLMIEEYITNHNMDVPNIRFVE